MKKSDNPYSVLYETLTVYLWHISWEDYVKVVPPKSWPTHLLDSGTKEDDDSFACWVSDNTGLNCTVERTRKITWHS